MAAITVVLAGHRAPKAIGLIGKLPPTLASRSIHIALKRMLRTDRVEPLREGRTSHLAPLFRKASRWAKDNANDLRAASDPSMPETLYGRAADNWRPLIAIADLVGGEWPEQARSIAERLSGRHDDLAPVMIIHDVFGLFQARGVDRLPSSEIVDALGQMEDRPWPEWKNAKPITPRQLARLLDPFGVVPTTISLTTGRTPKGYHLKPFAELVRRYSLDPPPYQSANPPQALETKDFGGFQSAAIKNEAADLSGEKSQKLNGYGGFADKKPPEAFSHGDGDPFASLRDPRFGLQPGKDD